MQTLRAESRLGTGKLRQERHVYSPSGGWRTKLRQERRGTESPEDRAHQVLHYEYAAPAGAWPVPGCSFP